MASPSGPVVPVVPPKDAAPTAALAQAAPAVDQAALAAQHDASLFNHLKNLLLYELRSVGYSPNPKDVNSAAVRIKELLIEAGGSAAAFVAAHEDKIKAFLAAEEAKAKEAEAEGKPAPAATVLETGGPVPKV